MDPTPEGSRSGARGRAPDDRGSSRVAQASHVEGPHDVEDTLRQRRDPGEDEQVSRVGASAPEETAERLMVASVKQ
jgi:hypothetical protein